jgi:hypothetical protein
MQPHAPAILPPAVHWTDDDGAVQQADWRSLASHPPPARVVLAGNDLGADAALRLLRAGTGLLWLGDYPNARHLLQALGRRLDARQARAPRAGAARSLRDAFLAQRAAQAERARVLGGVLLPFDADHGLPLRRAPDVRAAGGNRARAVFRAAGQAGGRSWPAFALDGDERRFRDGGHAGRDAHPGRIGAVWCAGVR